MDGSQWALVTGATRGIGRAAAWALARDGWNVVVHGRSDGAAAAATMAGIESEQRQTMFLAADFREPTAAKRLVDEAWRITGGLGAWIHNAGADVLTGPAAKLPFAEKLDLLTRVDVWGAMAACRAVGALMRQAGTGVIITVGWDQADTGMEGDSGELFAATKGAVMAFSRSLAKSLAPTVRVNCVAPGWIKTAWGEQASEAWQARACREALLGRWGQPDDIANAMAYLVSPSARFITGQTLYVNGGVVTS